MEKKMLVTPLDSRGKRVLQVIVEAYIESASPVSSQAIAQRMRTQISPATIRMIMAELDEQGLIWQPHTSAGRIPTDKGYRYYIDSLLEVEKLSQKERRFIDNQAPVHTEVFDELLTEVLRILSNFSGYTALAFSSGLRSILFKKLEFVSVQSTRILVVLVSQEGLVKTAVLKLPYKIEQRELRKMARFLNTEFAGLTLAEIKQRLSQRLMRSSDAFFHLLKKTTQIVELALASFEEDRLFLEGTSYIFTQPEFQDMQKLRAILRTFEQQKPLLEILKEDLGREGIRVHIGTENPCADIQECSLVVSNYKIKNRNMGTLGIIGPRRMSYAKVISTVGYMAQILNQRCRSFEA